MRTLLVSDLHLGQRPGHDVLRLDPVRERLIAALDGVDRLVLLGDVVELAARRHREAAMAIAAPLLSAIGHAVGPEREIVLVAGNHDVTMVRPWAIGRGAALGVADAVPTDATPMLSRVCELLAPARVSVRYPGLWVRDDVWATHGHYLDRHLVPESTFGLPRGRLARAAAAHRASVDAIEYELPRRRATRREGPWAELLDRPLAVVLERLAELTRYGTYVLRDVHLTSLTTRMLDLQARRAAVPAVALAATRIGVGARHVVFGHVHRTGPLAGEGPWTPLPGGPQIVNTGSWVYEPLLLDRAGAPHPYWPGGAVVVEDEGAPRVLSLLDDLPGAVLAPGRARPGR